MSDTDPATEAYGPAFWGRRAAELARVNLEVQNQVTRLEGELAEARRQLAEWQGAIVNWGEGCSGVAPVPSAEKCEAFG